MKRITFFTILILAAYFFPCRAQSVVVPKELHFSVDSASQNQLIESLNRFLKQKDKPNRDNEYVLKADLPAMSALLDELKGADKDPKLKDDHFYKPYVENVVGTGDGQLLVQVAYIGMQDGYPVISTSFRMMAKKAGDKYQFYSMLKQNIAGWKVKKISFGDFYYRDSLNMKEAKAYIDFLTACNKRLSVKAEPVLYYDCVNYPDVLQLLGIEYKQNYAGIQYDGLVGHEEGKTVTIIGGYTDKSRFDRHDLWHDRLRMVMPAGNINRPVDEGCAYLYGGSWGKTWPEVQSLFKAYVSSHPDADWLKLYTGLNNFYQDGQKKFFIAYYINALLVQKIEKEKGFAPVMELLGCGKKEAGDDNYFAALEKISGITRANFNQTVWTLIKED